MSSFVQKLEIAGGIYANLISGIPGPVNYTGGSNDWTFTTTVPQYTETDEPFFTGTPLQDPENWNTSGQHELMLAITCYNEDDEIDGYICWWLLGYSDGCQIEMNYCTDYTDFTSSIDRGITMGYGFSDPQPTWQYGFKFSYDVDKNCIGLYLIWHVESTYQNYYTVYNSYCYGVKIDEFSEHWNTHVEYTEESPEYGEASDVGGYGQGGNIGTFDDSSDTIGLPPMPSIGVSSVGFVNVYDISTGGLASFGMDLFPDLNFSPIGNLPAPADVTDALVNMATVLTTFGNQIPNMIDMYINKSLIDYIIDCHIIPVSPSVGGSENIKVGFKTFNQVANRVSSDYIDFDCGSLNIGEYYANFADYEPYTRCKLFLPFVGFVDLKPEFWQSGTISVKYRFNVVDGSFTAFVLSSSSKSKLSNTVIAQYGGNCCVHIPITGANYSNLVSGVVGGAAAIMAAQPGTGGSAALDAAVNLANTKANVQQSNGYNATTSFLGVRKPYLMIERTVSNMSSAYPDEIGIPCNINLDFSNLSGLVKSQDVILDGITGATDAELKEIARLLAGGIYF